MTATRLKFTKMEGAGNDFIVVDATRDPLRLAPEQIRALADRHFGVGFDQLLVIEPPRRPGTDFYYRIFNADGSEVSQCGNGARCFVRYLHDKSLIRKPAIRVETASGVIEPRLEGDGRVTVDMGSPVFEPSRIPFLAPARASRYAIEINGEMIDFGVVSMGNPHAVQMVTDLDSAPVTCQGPLIEHHSRFPERTNAGYMQVADRHTIRLRVWERGAGETLSCGSGACAAFVVGSAWGVVESPVTIHTRGGALSLAWGAEGINVLMTGPARSVFDGEIEIQGEK